MGAARRPSPAAASLRAQPAAPRVARGHCRAATAHAAPPAVPAGQPTLAVVTHGRHRGPAPHGRVGAPAQRRLNGRAAGLAVHPSRRGSCRLRRLWTASLGPVGLPWACAGAAPLRGRDGLGIATRDTRRDRRRRRRRVHDRMVSFRRHAAPARASGDGGGGGVDGIATSVDAPRQERRAVATMECPPGEPRGSCGPSALEQRPDRSVHSRVLDRAARSKITPPTTPNVAQAGVCKTPHEVSAQGERVRPLYLSPAPSTPQR